MLSKKTISLTSKIITVILVACFIVPTFICGCTPCNHNYVGSITKNATCNEMGIMMYKCTECDNSYTADIAKLTTHPYTSVVTRVATCGVNGIQTYSCSVCGDTYEEEIPATGNHSFTTKITKEPSCKETGIETNTCIICGNSYNRDIEKTNDHEYKSIVIKEASDTVQGEKKHTCSICGDSYVKPFLLSTVSINVARICATIKNGLNNHAGWLYCKIVSLEVSQDNVITALNIQFESDTTVSYYNDKVIFGYSISKVNKDGTTSYFTSRRLITPDVPSGETKIYTFKPNIQLSEGTSYIIKIFLVD